MIAIAALITSSPPPPLLETISLFPSNSQADESSPIDEFSKRLELINRLSPQPGSFDPNLAQLVLLGAMAAVESYLRRAFRETINLDETARRNAYAFDVSYAAAAHLSVDLMPEAVLERTSFVGRPAIAETLNKLIGLKGELPTDLQTALSAYHRVCQLRHCAVHRFGHLGAQNAMALGITEHAAFLERRLVLTYTALQEALAICEGLARTVNSSLFRLVMGRIPRDQCTGNYSKDRKWFRPIYVLFAAKLGSRPSPPAKDLYYQCRKDLRPDLLRVRRTRGRPRRAQN